MELSKKQIEQKIDEFFKNVKSKNPEEIRKIKKLAMSKNIKLKEKRKLFCKRCYSTKLEVKSIKKGVKRVKCKDCGHIMKWRTK